MLKFIKKEDQTKEEKVVHELSLYLGKKYNTKVDCIASSEITAMYINNNNFDLVLTVCDTPYGRRIKIEDFIIKEDCRNKKLGTKLINEITSFCKKSNCIVGLWCEKSNTKAYKFYINNGFEHITTVNDHWLEYR